jgi:site-specific recombinase XerD
MAQEARELICMITRGTDHELSSVGFTIANGGITAGLKVFIFLSSSGVDLVRKRAADTTQVNPLEPLAMTAERGGPATTAGFLKTIARTGEAAKLPFPIHPHMLRHSTGYKLANDGHDTRALQHYMGHKNIMHTVRYTEMAPDRFKNFWKD